MASQMVGILIGAAVLVLLSCIFCMIRVPEKESFVNPEYTPNSLEINLCPTFAPEIQTAKGNTDCCQGEMLDGKCTGATFCTKSPSYEGVSACVDKWREHFQKKGTELCPTTMPNYFEDITNANAVKGCSAGPILKDGKAPQQITRPKCRIYTNEKDNRTKIDSCYVERERLLMRCPVVNGRSPVPSMNTDVATNTFNFFFCQYPFEARMPDRCVDRKTMFAYMDRTNPSWRTQASTTSSVNEQLCGNYVTTRNKARERANKLDLERRIREALERDKRRLQTAFSRFRNLFRRNQRDTSRLQQQLDEANRRCRR